MAQTRDFYLNPIQNVGGVKLLKNETLECCPAAILFPINLLRSGFREIRSPHDSVLRAISFDYLHRPFYIYWHCKKADL